MNVHDRNACFNNDDTSTSSACDARDEKGLYIGTCDTSDAQDDNYPDAKGPLEGKGGEGPPQSSPLDASLPNIGQVNSISEKKPAERSKASDAKNAERKNCTGSKESFQSSHFEASDTSSSDESAIQTTGLKKERETQGRGIDNKNRKWPKGVKHSEENTLLNKTVGIKKHQKWSGYFKGSGFEKGRPLTGKGCPHSMFLQREDNSIGQQALGAPKINTQLGRVIYNSSKTDLKYIRWFIKI
jgi:hypothetical protein